MMTVAAAVYLWGCALTRPPVHLQAGGGRAGGRELGPDSSPALYSPRVGPVGAGREIHNLPQRSPQTPSSPPSRSSPGGGHPSRTLLAARPRPPQGEGGGRASWVFPGSPHPANIWPRTSAPSLCRRAPGRPRTHLPAPTAPAPSARAPSPRGGTRSPRPRPPGSVPTGRAREARRPICPALQIQPPGVPKGRGAVPRNAFQAGARPEQSIGCGASPARLGPPSSPRAAGPKGCRRSSPPPALLARPTGRPASLPPPPPLQSAPAGAGALAHPSASSPQVRNCGARLPGDAPVSRCSSNLFCEM